MVGLLLDSGRRPFLGSDDAVQQLLAQLTQGRHIVLAGPPGNGKSRRSRCRAEWGMPPMRIVARMPAGETNCSTGDMPSSSSPQPTA